MMRPGKFVPAVAVGALAAGALLSTAVAAAPARTPVPQSAGTAAVTRSAGVAAITTVPGQPADTWPNYHRDAGHTGYDPVTPPLTQLRRAWSDRLDGSVYGSPIQVSGSVIAATENDSVYAVDARTGRQRWRAHLGMPIRVSSLPCGNVDPLGITGTPAYDAASHRVFVVTVTRSGGTVRHTLFGLDVATGRVGVSRNVDAPRQSSNVQNQRGALAVANGRVYVPYGGHAGDCGDYHGTVVGSRTDGTGPLAVYRVPTRREAGIWTPGGIAVDGAGNLYVAVGNGAAGQDPDQLNAPYDQSDSVTKLSASLQRIGLFAPTSWRSENSADADLGSTGPLLVGRFVWIQGKAGTGYVLRQAQLGGIGGQVSTVKACERQFGGAAAHGLTVFAACTDGVRQVVISPSGRARAGWRAPGSVTGSPVVGGGVVWSLDVGSGVLYALDERTGKVRATAAVGAVTRFATPMLDGSLAVVPTLGGLTAVSGA